MPRKLSGSAIVPGTITVTQIAGSFNETSNASYSQANSARNQANSAYGQANSGVTIAGDAYGAANTAETNALNAYAQANLAYAAANNSNLLSGGLVSGTLNVTQDLIVGGNIYLEGNTTYINVATYSIEDSLVYYASNNSLTDSVDIGFMGGKNTSGTYSHTGFARDATDGKWKLFDGLPEEGHVGNVINFANTYLATLVANVEANTLTVVNGVSGNVNFDSGTLFVDSVGNSVGIGTSSPSSKLDVLGKVSINSDGTLNWGNAKDYGRLTWDTGKAIVRGESGKGLSLGANGTQDYLYVATSGNIGVGTTSPTDTLGYGRALDIQSNAGAAVYLRDSDNTGEYTSLGYEGGSAKNFSIYNTAAGDVRIYTSGSQRLTVSSVGNVGIGTSSPTHKLQTNGSGRFGTMTTGPGLLSGSSDTFQVGLNQDNTNTTNTQVWAEYVNGATSASWAVRYRAANDTGTASTRLYLDAANGNVGIGTTNPVANLIISNGGASGLELYHSGAINGGPYIQAYNRSSSAYMHLTNYALSHTWYVGGTRAMDIDAAGYVGIGTSNPANRLHVTNGSVGSNVSNSIIHAEISGARHHLDFKEIRTSNTSDWNATTYKLQMRVDATNHQSIDFVSDSSYNEHIDIYTGNQIFNTRFHQNGNVGVGNTAPSSKLTVAGTIESTTGGVKFPDGTTQTTAASAGADPIPSGTVMLFVQTSAPTGWTKSTTHNDKALRVVSGSVSTGGSVAFTSAFASQSVAGSISSTTQGGTVSTSVSGSVSGSVGSTTLSTSEMPSHGHSVTDNGVGVTVYDSSVAGGGPYGTVARAATQSAGAGLTINSTGGGGSHNHSWSGSFSGSASSTFTGSSHGHTFTGTAINLAVQYVDVIIATKN